MRRCKSLETQGTAIGSGLRISTRDTILTIIRGLLISARGAAELRRPGLPNDARDRSDGFWNNFSHGTGTISILAGAPAGNLSFGCAPYAEVIPIRVANRVVLFSNSTIAQAFDYVHSLCRAGKQVHVITMSMGGYPSQAWADAINALYEVGVVVVTAAGNNYDNLPTHYIVYPARFNRVIAACGVMANLKPYADLRFDLMAGNYGPDNKMKTAIAAYTPNVPWARYGEPDIVDLDGAGTSAATPQVAASAALWIQKNREAYDAYPEPWMRVEAVRKALFDSAGKDPDHVAWLGNGRVCARSLLDEQPAKLPNSPNSRSTMQAMPSQSCWLELPLAAAPQASTAMLALEAQQLAQSMGLEGHLEVGRGAAAKADIIDRLLEAKGISGALRKALEGLAGKPLAAVQETCSLEPRHPRKRSRTRLRWNAPKIRNTRSLQRGSCASSPMILRWRLIPRCTGPTRLSFRSSGRRLSSLARLASTLKWSMSIRRQSAVTHL